MTVLAFVVLLDEVLKTLAPPKTGISTSGSSLQRGICVSDTRDRRSRSKRHADLTDDMHEHQGSRDQGASKPGATNEFGWQVVKRKAW